MIAGRASAACIDYTQHLRRVSGLDTGSAIEVAVLNDLAVSAQRNAGLHIVSLSDPLAPSLLGTVSTTDARAVAVSGSHAFVADGSAGLRVVDLSSPDAPTVVATLGVPGTAKDVATDGVLACVAADGLRVIDVSDPAAPAERGHADLPGWALAVDLHGSHAYVVDQDPISLDIWLRVVDLSSPETPAIVGNAYLGHVLPPRMPRGSERGPGGLALSGDRAYVAMRGSVTIVDVSVPGDPTITSSLPVPSFFARDVWVSDGLLFVAQWSEGVLVADVTNPDEPAIVGIADTPGEATGICVLDDHIVVADGSSGIQLLDASTPSSPDALAELPLASPPHETVYADGYAYVARYSSSIDVVDLSSPSSPVVVTTLEVAPVFLDIAVAGDRLYALSDPYGLHIFDVSDPEHPVEKDGFTQLYEPKAFDVQGVIGVAVDAAWGLRVIDFASADAPFIIATASIPLEMVTGVAIHDGVAYVLGRESGVTIVDVDPPWLPTVLDTLATPGEAQDIAFAGDLAILADGSAGLRVVDIAEPSAATIVGTLSRPDFASRVAVRDDHVYVTDTSYTGGVYVVSLANPAAPELLGGTYLAPILGFQAWAIDVADEHVLVAGSGLEHDLFVFPTQCEMTTPIEPGAPAPPSVSPRPRLVAAPNPFSGSSRLTFGVPSAARSVLDVFDVAGRLVTSEELGVLEAGVHTFMLDARPPTGPRLAPGVWFVRLRMGGITSDALRLVRLE